MLIITREEIERYRVQLADYSEALTALDELENCEGDLEDAAVNLAIHVGQQPDRTEWLDGLAKRCRAQICDPNLQQELMKGNLIMIVDSLIKSRICPPVLVTLVVLYVLKKGVQEFCEPLNFKLNYSP